MSVSFNIYYTAIINLFNEILFSKVEEIIKDESPCIQKKIAMILNFIYFMLNTMHFTKGLVLSWEYIPQLVLEASTESLLCLPSLQSWLLGFKNTKIIICIILFSSCFHL